MLEEEKLEMMAGLREEATRAAAEEREQLELEELELQLLLESGSTKSKGTKPADDIVWDNASAEKTLPLKRYSPQLQNPTKLFLLNP